MPRAKAHFRIDEEKAVLWLPPDAGRVLGPDSPLPVRAVDAEVGGPLYEQIGAADQVLRQHGDHFFSDWDIRRRYSKTEIARADVFRWRLTTRFEPAGEEFDDDLYDYSRACPVCRVGRRQRRDLVLNLSKVPRKDVAMSIGHETVVSERFVELVTRADLSGTSFRPVKHYRRTSRPITPRWQLVLPEPSVSVLAPPTEFGIDPFDRDPEGTYLCPNGHTAGLNLLSEVTVRQPTWNGADLATTLEHVGNPWPADASLPREEWSYGLQVPMPIILISPRFYRLLVDNRLTGWRAEVAYLA